MICSLKDWKNTFKYDSIGVTIGNFDGVHRGHQALLLAFKKRCEEMSITPIVFTFNPHPELYFNPNKRYLLTSYKKKYEILNDLGLKNVVEIPFSDIRELNGEGFASQFLLSHDGLKLIWIGHDFSFGCDRADPRSVFLDKGVELDVFQAEKIDGVTVCSSLVRDELKQGNVAKAALYLGRPFSVFGQVGHGRKLGRQLGFPTMNIEIPYPSCVPAFGVYRVSCVMDGEVLNGVMNVGVNPSVVEGEEIKWEVHLLGYQGDAYHKHVEIRFEEFIRAEKKFDSLEQLKAQIKSDIEEVEKSLG